MISHEKEKYSIKSVETALYFLNALSEEGEEFGISCLCKKLGLNKNNVFRLMATFEKWGYVEQIKSSSKYRVGLSAYETGQKFLSSMKLLRSAKPVMESLSRECDETVYLAVPAGTEFLLLDKVDATNPVGIMSLVGRRYPLSRSAAGKVILAFNAEKITNKTGKESTRLEENLTAIRHRGFSSDVGSIGEGVASMAVPLLNTQKRVLGCLCFVGPQYRFTDQRIQRDLLSRLKSAGQIVSSQLGYLGC